MTKLHNRGGKRESPKPKSEKAQHDNNRKVIAFTIDPDLLSSLDSEANTLKISRSEAVNRILLGHFAPKPPQVNQGDFKAMQSTIEQMNEAVNRLLAKFDSQNDNEGIRALNEFSHALENPPGEKIPDWFTSEKPTFEELISTPAPHFGQWLAENILPLSPELQSQYKAPWLIADPNTLNGLRHYGPELIEAIKAGNLKLHPEQAKAFSSMDDQRCRNMLINLAGIAL